MPATYYFYIDGISCTSCSNSIAQALKNKLKNKLKSCDVYFTTDNPRKTRVILENNEDNRAHQTIWSELKQYIEDSGFYCKEYGYNLETIQKDISSNAPKAKTQQKHVLNNKFTKIKSALTSHWFFGALGCIAGFAVLIACFAVTGGSLAFMIPLAICSTLATLALGANSYYEAWSKLTKTGTLTMDSLFTLSSLSILAVSIASLFVPGLPMMFEAGLLIYGFRHLGIAIEKTIKEKIGTARFQDRAPRTVRKHTEAGIKEISLDAIEINDVILVHAGEIIPLDGACEDGSTIYDTIVTGSTLPRHFAANQKVLAGMRLAAHAEPLKIRVAKTHANSYLKRLDQAVENAALEKAPIEIKTSQLLTYFIPVIIALAAISGTIMGIFFSPALAIQCIISVLVSACPCTLGLIIPLAVKTGMHKAAEHGVQFKNAKTLQQAEQVDTIVFDLNGTLTTGIPEVNTLHILDKNLSETELRSICATLEQKSTHPIGKAIYSFANQKTLDISALDMTKHSGISGMIQGHRYTIGSKTSMIDSIPADFKQPKLNPGDQLVYIARDKQIIGLIILTIPLRQDASSTIAKLKAMGKKIHLCTGADEETARRYAEALGIDRISADRVAVAAEHTDNSKKSYISALQKEGHVVAMVGDAGNDAEAIAASNLGIAIASDGSDELTQEKAGIVIHNGTLLPLASAFAVSKQTVANINQNLAISLLYNVITIGAAITLTLNPVICVVLMIVQACFILMNVYRFKRQSLEHVYKKTTQEAEEPSFAQSSHSKMNEHNPVCKNKLICEQESPESKSTYTPLWVNKANKKMIMPHHAESDQQLMTSIRC